MKKLAFAGSFDPITKGHLWVIQEALNMAEEVYVILAVNSNKKPLFDEQTRTLMVQAAVNTLEGACRVKVISSKNEYVAQLASVTLKCDYLIRGIRSSVDFDYENIIQKTNTDVLYGAKTLFVIPPKDLDSVSSSFVKSLVGPVGWHWHIKSFIPDYVYTVWLEKYITDTAVAYCGKEVLPFVQQAIEAYSQDGRFYHNCEHIAHCLQELQWFEVQNPLSHKDLRYLCLSILGHDIVYGKSDKDKTDEQLSAEVTVAALQKCFPQLKSSEVEKLILSTQHLTGHAKKDKLAQILSSIDLAILAKPYPIYKEYCDNIRREYSKYPDSEFKAGRIHALEKLLTIPQLFASPAFSHYEELARQNLSQELAELKRFI